MRRKTGALDSLPPTKLPLKPRRPRALALVWTLGRHLFDQAVLHRVEDQLRGAAEAHLVEDPRPIRPHRLGAEAELLRDVVDPDAGSQAPEDLVLTVRQRLVGGERRAFAEADGQLLAAGLAAAVCAAQSPTTELVPVTATSRPFFSTTIDLSPYGYVEDEYLVDQVPRPPQCSPGRGLTKAYCATSTFTSVKRRRLSQGSPP
jgi:hypothetical protein